MQPAAHDPKKEIAQLMRRLYRKNLTTSLGGNISFRTQEGILMTPSSTDKACMKKRHIVLFTMDGRNLTPNLKPTIESEMHLEIYKVRKDINAIVHAHPPLASAFTAMMKQIDCNLIAESKAVLGTPLKAAYGLMGTKDLASTVADAALKTNVILMENHGIVCLGQTLLSAFNRMEVLEAAARMTIVTHMLNDRQPLTEDQIKAIESLF